MRYRYLIVFNDTMNDPYYTNWYDYHNNWREGMTVIDFKYHKWTRNGVDWLNIEEDHL